MNRHFLKFVLIALSTLILISCSNSKSLVTEKIHERILNKSFDGDTLSIKNLFDKPIEIYIPKSFVVEKDFSLLIHFHGASYVPKAAVESVDENIILVVVNLGIGSSVYEKPFFDESTFPKLIDEIYSTIRESRPKIKKSEKIFLTSFSAGYGSVRRILQFHNKLITGVILMDGMHTDYIPDGLELSKGGKLNVEKLDLYIPLAQSAIEEKKFFLVSHSDIYPATYASNKETSDYLIEKLNLVRIPKDEINLIGMHQTSEAKKGNFIVFGFDGNTARDHVDHYHSMPLLLCKIFNKKFIMSEFLEQ